MKYKKNSICGMIEDEIQQIIQQRAKRITRKKLAISLLILQGKSLQEIERDFGYNLKVDLI